jgi:ABC-type Fe3+ transport system permease subunit
MTAQSKPEGPMASSQPPATERPRSRIGRWWWVVGLAVAGLVVVILAPLASADPDGLERVAEDQGFIGLATNFFAGLLGDYAIPGVDNAWLSTVLAGLLGVAIVVVVVFLVGRLVARRRA